VRFESIGRDEGVGLAYGPGAEAARCAYRWRALARRGAWRADSSTNPSYVARISYPTWAATPAQVHRPHTTTGPRHGRALHRQQPHRAASCSTRKCSVYAGLRRTRAGTCSALRIQQDRRPALAGQPISALFARRRLLTAAAGSQNALLTVQLTFSNTWPRSRQIPQKFVLGAGKNASRQAITPRSTPRSLRPAPVKEPRLDLLPFACWTAFSMLHCTIAPARAECAGWRSLARRSFRELTVIGRTRLGGAASPRFF
jgi:hypothetical protein